MTDEEILAIAHRTATVYRHRSEPESPSYGFMNHTILDFARRIEQAATTQERERGRLAMRDAVMASLDEAGIYAEVLRGMCVEVALERFDDAIRKGE